MKKPIQRLHADTRYVIGAGQELKLAEKTIMKLPAPFVVKIYIMYKP
jgi:hypothetical protein